MPYLRSPSLVLARVVRGCVLTALATPALYEPIPLGPPTEHGARTHQCGPRTARVRFETSFVRGWAAACATSLIGRS